MSELPSQDLITEARLSAIEIAIRMVANEVEALTNAEVARPALQNGLEIADRLTVRLGRSEFADQPHAHAVLTQIRERLHAILGEKPSNIGAS